VDIDRKLFHYNVSGGGEGVWQVRQSDKALKFNTWNGNWLGVVTVNDVFVDTDWHHIALVREGAVVTIYVDGALQVTTGIIHATLSTSSNHTFYVGSRTNIEHWYGEIDEVRIWDHARTEAEILQDMNLELTGLEPGLEAYYDFNEGAGQTAFDSSPNAYDGTLGSTPGVDANDPEWIPAAP
jgi:hypothetical protein